MAAVRISLIKTGMVSVITVRMPGKEKEIPMVVEWAISIGMDKVREIVAEVDVGTNTGMVEGIKIHLPLNSRNLTTKISKHE
jgi:hypothetical protein